MATVSSLLLALHRTRGHYYAVGRGATAFLSTTGLAPRHYENGHSVAGRRSFSSLDGESAARKFVEQVVRENDVTLFMKGTPKSPKCGFSRAVCQILDFYGVRNIAAVDVLEDGDIRAEVKKFSSWPTIPQVFVKGHFVGGCDIMMEMHKSGDLEALLVKEKIIASEEAPPSEGAAGGQSDCGNKK